MRFGKIHIPAFGPFTELKIDLPDKGGDFHLFYGPNEAGKSSLLRGLRALLFGIPTKTGDNFIHNYNQMRIAAELVKRDGTARYFKRRKGSKNTLLDENDGTLPEAELGAFLGVVNEEYFNSMFGLGSDELREGANALLRGAGRAGEALFSASLGGTPVDEVIRGLESEATALFRGRGHSAITHSRKQLGEALKLSKSSSIKPGAWEEVVTAIAGRELNCQALQEQRNTCQSHKSWLERCRDMLPVVGQYRDCLRQFDELPPMPDLAESFGGEIIEARRVWRAADSRIEPMTLQLAALRDEAATCQLAPKVLAAEAEIHGLHTGIGVYREQSRTLAAKRAEAAQASQRIAAACRDLEIGGEIDELDDGRISQVTFQEAVAKALALEAAAQALAADEDTALALDREIAKLKARRAPDDAADIPALEQAVAATQSLEDQACRLGDRKSAAAALRKKLEGLHQRLPGAPAEIAAVRLLAVPLKASIGNYRERFEELERKGADLAKRRDDEQTKADLAKAEIERIKRLKDLPSLEDLAHARNHREQGWKMILKDWKGTETTAVFSADGPLEEAYPEAVAAADDVADRLRTDAEAVARMEEQRSQLKLAEAALAALAAQMTQLAEDSSTAGEQWKAAWQSCGLTPLSPREMEEWRDQWEEFGRSWDQWSEEAETLAAQEAAIAKAVAVLQQASGVRDEDLPALLAVARKRIKDHHKALGADESLRTQIANKEFERQATGEALPRLRAAVEAARAAWNSCRTERSLPDRLPAGQAIDLLRSRRELYKDHDDWRRMISECDDLETAVATYQQKVSATILRLEFNSSGTEADQATLWKALELAKSAQQEFKDLERRIRDQSAELEVARQAAKTARETLDVMLSAAALGSDDALDGFLQRFESKGKLSARLRTLRESLAGSARDLEVEEFIKRVEDEGRTGLGNSLSAHDQKISELDVAIEEIRSELRDLTARRKSMEDASDESASQSQLAEMACARIRRDGERFVRLQLAITLLKSQIDRFREQNQGPFMEKAGHWFAEITGRAFAGITTCYDAGDQPVIAGRRAGDGTATVGVAAMSEGTRDQLFLALRLAGLEMHLEDHEPMPLILDDLLVNFDDERSLNTLTALREFGQRSQVLMFTHHAHVVELARQAWGAKGLHLHDLPAANAANTPAA